MRPHGSNEAMVVSLSSSWTWTTPRQSTIGLGIPRVTRFSKRSPRALSDVNAGPTPQRASGGDEFGVLVEQIGHPGEAIKLAERILMATRPPLTLGANEVSATVSIGIAFDGPGISSDQLLCNARDVCREGTRGKPTRGVRGQDARK